MTKDVILYQKGRDAMYNIWHENENSCYLYVHEGEGSIVFSNAIIPLMKGYLYYIPSIKQHYTLPQDSKVYVRSKIFISNENSAKIITSTLNDMIYSAQSVVYAQIPPEEQKNIERILSVLENTGVNEKSERMFVTGTVLQLHAYLKTYKTDKTRVFDDYIEKSLQYINSNVASQLTVDSICNAVNLSKYYFCHIFKKTLGLSVMKYVLDTRLSLAKEMLISGKFSISQISEKCGFETSSNFCHQFKKHTGMTASEYRKTMKSG